MCTLTEKRPLFEVRNSPIAGLGGFAVHLIPKGTRIVEYAGERISPEEADARYDDDKSEHPLVVLFTVDRKTVIDAGVGGNEARFINHSCDPNCEAVIEKKRVFIEAIRDIPAGRELTYDYSLTREGKFDAETERRYACRCGARNCRGTMLEPVKGRRKKSTSGRNK
jgi:SET domain-containing protein